MSTIIDLSKVTGGISFNLGDLASVQVSDGVTLQDVLTGLGKGAATLAATQLNKDFRNPKVAGVLPGALTGVFDKLSDGIENTFKQLQSRIIADLPFGQDVRLQQTLAQRTLQDFRDRTGTEFTGIADIDTIQDATRALFDQEGALGSLVQKLKLAPSDLSSIAADLGSAFAILAKSGDESGPAELLKQVDALGKTLVGVKNPVEAFREGINRIISSNARLSRELKTPLGSTIRLTSAELQKLSFLGFNTATKETEKLLLAGRKFGVQFGDLITKPLLTFQEAGEVASSLGVVLKGVNFDVNEFVAAKPSERAKIALGELASAFRDGRLEIEEDGVAFGQQVAIFQRALGGIVDPKSVETALRNIRGGRIDEVLSALEEGAVGPEVSVAEAADIRRRTVPLKTARDRLKREVGASALETGAVAPALTELVTGLQTAIDGFRESGLLQTATPLVVELNKFAEFSKVFSEKGGFQGLVPFALFGNLSLEEVERSITRVTNNTDFETLMTTLGDKGNKLVELSNNLAAAGGEVVEDVTNLLPDAIKKAFVESFTDNAVVDAIAAGYEEGAKLAKQILLGGS